MVEKSTKQTRREYLAGLLKNVAERSPSYDSVDIEEVPNESDYVRIKLNKKVTDLNRFKNLPHSSTYLYNKKKNKIFTVSELEEESCKSDIVT